MESRSVPTAVKVFGILHTVFGSFSLAISPLNLINLNQSLSVFEKLGIGAATIGWVRIQTFLAPILAAIMLALGIGLLMKKPWARPGAVNFGYVQIAVALISGILTAIGFSSALGSGDDASSAVAIGGMIGGLFSAVIGCVYPALTIFFMNKPNVKAALDR